MPTKIKSSSNTPQIIGYIVVIVIIVAIVGAIVYIYNVQQQSSALPEETQITKNQTGGIAEPTPTPTPTKLFHGKDTYNLSGGMPDDPHFPVVTIDPLDPDVGASQTFTVTITSKYPVKLAYLTIHTDKQNTKLPLVLMSDDRTNATWQATWKMPETYIWNYQISPYAQTDYSQGTATITVRERK